MKSGIIMGLITAAFVTSCNIHVQVKKDAKNAKLNSTQSSGSLNATETQDFLKQIDGLRTTAADLIIKQMAQHDYVGAFRGAVRKYRSFIIEKSGKPVIITDSFYTDTSKDCRESGLSLNADDHNEMLGMILKTAILAKISEADVGKLNAGLAKEMQAITQFITMELGVEIVGTSSATDENGVKTTKGNVKIKLLPIADENVDASVKHRDEVEVLSLNFERSLGSDMIGTFMATMDLSFEKDGAPSEASGTLSVSRVKTGENHVHDVLMSMGIKGSTPSYVRQIIVTDDSKDSAKFKFTDVLNAGTNNEARHDSIIDIKAGTQCKAKPEDRGTDKSSEDKQEDSGDDKGQDDSDKGSDPVKPENKPTQSPTQSPVQTKIGNTPSQMKS